jgi:hypothetical protein
LQALGAGDWPRNVFDPVTFVPVVGELMAKVSLKPVIGPASAGKAPRKWTP